MSMTFLGLMVSFPWCFDFPYYDMLYADHATPPSGAKKKCAELGIKLLGDIPLHARICSDADAGKPTVVGSPQSPQAQAFTKLAQELKTQLGI